MEEIGPAVWSVGHSNHSFETFAALLRQHDINCIVDVRSYPYSKFAPHFGREDLREQLLDRGVRYLFLGDELGGRPSSEDHYDADGHALYGPMSTESAFVAAINRVLDGSSRFRVALLCSEGQPHDCHRRLLVGKVLAERGVELRHILPDGELRVETTVSLGSASGQSSFFEEEAPWRSTQSVSHRRRLSTSLGA